MIINVPTLAPHAGAQALAGQSGMRTRLTDTIPSHPHGILSLLSPSFESPSSETCTINRGLTRVGMPTFFVRVDLNQDAPYIDQVIISPSPRKTKKLPSQAHHLGLPLCYLY